MGGTTPARGQFKVSVPERWTVVQPKSSIIQAEFALPHVDGDENDGRVTVTTAGGSIDENLRRWRTQFEELEEKPVEEIDVSGTKVTLVDFSGTFHDRRGMGPVTICPGYRMLAAIIESPTGFVFVKGYGPVNTVAEYADEFRGFVESLASPEKGEK